MRIPAPCIGTLGLGIINYKRVAITISKRDIRYVYPDPDNAY